MCSPPHSVGHTGTIFVLEPQILVIFFSNVKLVLDESFSVYCDISWQIFVSSWLTQHQKEDDVFHVSQVCHVPGMS